MNCKFCKYAKGDSARVSWEKRSYCMKCKNEVLPMSHGIEVICENMSEENYHIFWFRTPLVCVCGNILKKIFVPCQDLNSMTTDRSGIKIS